MNQATLATAEADPRSNHAEEQNHEHGQEDHDHSLAWVDLLRIGLVAVAVAASWFGLWKSLAGLLGLGEMPTAPVVEYLARSLSASYAVTGALCLVVAADLERYRFLGAASALMSPVLLGVDLVAGMPWWWSASEGPGG